MYSPTGRTGSETTTPLLESASNAAPAFAVNGCGDIRTWKTRSGLFGNVQITRSPGFAQHISGDTAGVAASNIWMGFVRQAGIASRRSTPMRNSSTGFIRYACSRAMASVMASSHGAMRCARPDEPAGICPFSSAFSAGRWNRIPEVARRLPDSPGCRNAAALQLRAAFHVS